MRSLPGIFLLSLLVACEAPGFAPIGDLILQRPTPTAKPADAREKVASSSAAQASVTQDKEITVQKGDTLFAIAFQHGLDYRDLAFWNNLASPDLIKVGQTLRLLPPESLRNKSGAVETLPIREINSPQVRKIAEPPLLLEPKAQWLPYTESNWALLSGTTQEAPKPESIKQAAAPAQPSSIASVQAATAQPPRDNQVEDDEPWAWPSMGAIIGRFGEGGGKGVNIAGERQSPVLSAASGKVVYSGAGLRGYGKMVIVKHPGEFLTAYAHNHAILVKEGDWVRQGQKIAEMGETDSDRVKLHFEIRQYGKPLDPLKYLPERK